jgi:hydrogenase-4 component F
MVCYVVKSPRLIGYANLVGIVALAAYAAPIIAGAVSTPIFAANGALFMDAFSAYIMGLMILYSLAAAVYSIGYLENELAAGLIDFRGMRRYYGLFHLFVFTMLVVTMADNLALMWIGMEATTIVSALLIGLGFRPLHRGYYVRAPRHVHYLLRFDRGHGR